MSYIARLQDHQLNHPALEFNNPALLPASVPYTGEPLLRLIGETPSRDGCRGARERMLQRLSLPPPWVEGLKRLSPARKPDRCSHDRWKQVVEDVDHIAEHWAEPAYVAGWQMLELFGCAPNLGRRLDMSGLAALLEGRKVTSVAPDAIAIATGKIRTSFRRKRMECSLLIWDL
jgi:hypothetical protein